jgi:hypothetical protein
VDALLVIVGAIIGAVGSIVGGVIAANRQFQDSRRERRESREEAAVRELAQLAWPVAVGARHLREGMDLRFGSRGESDDLESLVASLRPAMDRFWEALRTRLSFDIHHPVLRPAAEALDLAIGEFDEPLTYKEGDKWFVVHRVPRDWVVRFVDRAAGHLEHVMAAYARGEELDPTDWPAPRADDPENHAALPRLVLSMPVADWTFVRVLGASGVKHLLELLSRARSDPGPLRAYIERDITLGEDVPAALVDEPVRPDEVTAVQGFLRELAEALNHEGGLERYGRWIAGLRAYTSGM